MKPENVLLSGDAAVVTDFGIAKALSASRTKAPGGTLTQVGTSLGTPAYMAPEQAAADPATDHRADIYSLGCLAYEMLAGAPPFAGRPAHQLFAAHMSEAPAPLGSHRPDAPPVLVAMVMRCLEKDPARRPQSAREVLQSLEGVTSGAHAAGGLLRRRWWAPAAVLLMATVAASAWFLKGQGTPNGGAGGSGARSLAVLPFVNANGDTASDYFAVGMSDEVAGVLAKLPELRVASRRSVDVVSAKQLSPQEMGRALGVGLLLEGTVRRAGDRVRVTAQLTNAADASIRWTKSYDRTTRDAFQLQDDIASAIAGELRLALGGAAAAASRAGRTTNKEAYDLYLRGRYTAAAGTEAALRQAIGYYERALELDPGFSRAHAGIGLAWLSLADAFVPAAEAYPHAVDAARRALALDSLLAEAHTAYGYATAVLTFDTAAVRSVRRAVELDPNSADVRWLHGQLLCWYLVNRCADGIRETEKAVELDPLSPLPQWSLAASHYFAKRYDEAIAVRQRLHEVDPRFFVFEDWAAASWREKGDFARAAREYEAVQHLWPLPLHGRGVTYARMGRADDARSVAREMERVRASGGHVTPDFIAMIYASVGDADRAFHWLEQARKEKSAWLFFLGVLPEYEPIRGDPRYAAFVRSLNPR
jgi:serine/threonine-protein kinase